MSIPSQLSNAFDSTIRSRGADYFRSGRVKIDSASAARIVATVRGSSRYRVELERTGRRVNVYCTCAYFDIGLCKHLWAVLLAAEGQPLLQGPRLELVSDLDDLDDDLDDDELDEDELDEDEFADEDDFDPHPSRLVPARPAGSPQPKHWRKQIAHVTNAALEHPAVPASTPAARQLIYVIDICGSDADGALCLDVLCRERKLDGSWGKPKARHLYRELQLQYADPDDRSILAFLAGATPLYGQALTGYSPLGTFGSLTHRYGLVDPQPRMLLPVLCRTGRCHVRLPASVGAGGENYGPPLTWQPEPWQLRLEVRASAAAEYYELTGALWRGEEHMDLTTPISIPEMGVLFTSESAAPYEPPEACKWIALLREHGSIKVPRAQGEEFIVELLRQPLLPALDLPEELRCEEVRLAPRPRLTVKLDKGRGSDWLHGELSFDYDGQILTRSQPDRGLVQTAARRILLRDFTAENTAEEHLHRLGWRWSTPGYMNRQPKLELAARYLPEVVRELTAAGWYVEAQGKLYRSPGKFDMHVSSGVDWFELHGTVDFDGTIAQLPELLAALRRGDHTVQLDDGSFGVLPQHWLAQYGLLVGLGESRDNHLRFRRTQAGLLDALLAAQPEARYDESFAQVRDRLRNFGGIRAQPAPSGFTGELRPYQQEALGWFDFLRHFGFGGCLADDMGLGKTVQVLALLEARRELRELCHDTAPQQAQPETAAAPAPGVSLAVVPRSLIFNWKQEAARFAPRLRVLDHTGSQRRLSGCEHLRDYDLVLTTYGTLRNDAAEFKDIEFDYIILDEAQSIKNADSASAKAARLLRGAHRLALSGTPIENHLGELWSLFEFLNPGMLGAASVFQMAQGAGRNPDENVRRLLSQALRPFILRRTKEQVARELPPKIEQTIYCDLDTRQRRLYDQLRDHYRDSLLKRVASSGMQRSKIQILEALLRLRQAAIHPGLLDNERLTESSAKLDVLLPSVLEAIAEGHKTLVFSQFTSMLAIVRQRLDRAGIVYEYLDGRTRDREARVERFQSDPACKLFLISLKAGGLGLNLTAAQYVFLLDPWWNPAVEAQAMDRAHRIGQTRQVFAYRLIARDTVEEKVVELQNNKRDLADAIIGANEGLLRHLGKEDLELLLS